MTNKEYMQLAVDIYFNLDTRIKEAINLVNNIRKDEKMQGKKIAIKKNDLERKILQGKSTKEIAKEYNCSVPVIHGRIRDFKLLSPKTLEKIKEEEMKLISYKPPKLEIGKNYKLNELDSDKRIKSYSEVKGKVIAEFDNFYRLDRGKYIECINKNCMMDLIIKEL